MHCLLFFGLWFFKCSNLTDGLDGLVSGTAAIAFGAFAVLLGVNLSLK